MSWLSEISNSAVSFVVRAGQSVVASFLPTGQLFLTGSQPAVSSLGGQWQLQAAGSTVATVSEAQFVLGSGVGLTTTSISDNAGQVTISNPLTLTDLNDGTPGAHVQYGPTPTSGSSWIIPFDPKNPTDGMSTLVPRAPSRVIIDCPCINFSNSSAGSGNTFTLAFNGPTAPRLRRSPLVLLPLDPW